MKCPYCNEFRGNSKVRGYPVKEQLILHIEVKHRDKLTPAPSRTAGLSKPVEENNQMTCYHCKKAIQTRTWGVNFAGKALCWSCVRKWKKIWRNFNELEAVK